jgi:hypothetical protein
MDLQINPNQLARAAKMKEPVVFLRPFGHAEDDAGNPTGPAFLKGHVYDAARNDYLAHLADDKIKQGGQLVCCRVNENGQEEVAVADPVQCEKPEPLPKKRKRGRPQKKKAGPKAKRVQVIALAKRYGITYKEVAATLVSAKVLDTTGKTRLHVLWVDEAKAVAALGG